MRLKSRFPSVRNSDATYQILDQYLNFISVIPNHSWLDFVDRKPMKEIMIYGKVYRNPFIGNILTHEMNANSKNWYNILAAVTIII